MKKITSTDALAAATARLAQSQSAQVQRDLRSLRDSMSGLTRAIKAAKIGTPRSVVKGSRSSLNPLLGSALSALTRYGLNSYLHGDDADDGSDEGDSLSSDTSRFYRSESQVAGRALGDLLTGQRVR